VAREAPSLCHNNIAQTTTCVGIVNALRISKNELIAGLRQQVGDLRGLADDRKRRYDALLQATQELLPTVAHAQLFSRYVQILNEMEQAMPEIDDKQEKAEQIVKAIISELYGRGGFDGWWDSIDGLTQTEIRVKLSEIVTEKL
jgi:hypothetical protein